jgi:tetratricopeptide (TPR) repeat protein
MAPTNIVRFGAFVAATAILLQPAFGQGRGGTQGAGGTAPAGGGTPTTTTPGTTTPSPTRPTTPTPGQQQQQQQQQQMQQPIFISGRVLQEDGSPATNVVIERVCSGSARSEGYTDSKGYFSIQLGARNGAMLHDASEDMTFGGAAGSDPFSRGTSGGSRAAFGSENRFFDCELRARMAGFRSQSVSLANRRPMDPPDIGTILVHRLGASEGTTVSALSLNAPKDARKAYEKGIDNAKKKKLDDAVKSFEKAVEVYPKYASAWHELGRIQAAKGDVDSARKSFDSAVTADPKFVSPYMELAVIEWKGEKWQEVADLTSKVIKLDSFDYPQAHFLNALSNYYLKNFDDAEKSARTAVRLDTRKQYLTTLRLLGVLLAQKQDYSGAAEQFKAYLTAAPQAQDAAMVRGQLAKLEEMLAGKPAQQQDQ